MSELFFGKVLTKIRLCVKIQLEICDIDITIMYAKGKRCFFVGEYDIDTTSINLYTERKISMEGQI